MTQVDPYHTNSEFAARLLCSAPSDVFTQGVDLTEYIPKLPTKPARKRKASLARTIKQAEKAAGKPVTSVTLPDGTSSHLASPSPPQRRTRGSPISR